ncbi:thioesterase II family protein [Pseudomonas sp. 6D_7.1_Bac1]|uniref:thioesterase II family protein n=1 Tax=Pseudomonas sp. 6D_7.1_Bac1 TaxID=2971615 RepID=UPI0021C88288|nr:alpha/beta fold hydrolase [Pseudomonas sp. 6D_7.1_Bac1]MCU1749449.1 alpha/beta fold hydrolase [Pseudomonas sp. 6D_7.1_Bac1]
MHARNTPWLTVINAGQATDVRLICFSEAGADPEQFRSWTQALSEHIELLAFRLPGPGNPQNQTPYEQWPPLLVDAFAALQPYLSEPHAFFGHGLGAILAYELAKLSEIRCPGQTRHLFISGCRSPDTRPATAPLHNGHALSSPGPFPDASTNNQLAAYEALIQSDLKLLESWADPSSRSLHIPMTAFYGSDDPLAPLESMVNWREFTRREFELIEMTGNHFFTITQRHRLLQIINTHLGLLSE